MVFLYYVSICLRPKSWASMDQAPGPIIATVPPNVANTIGLQDGNENWKFDENGLMRQRFASINDLPIKESDRKFYWLLGRRPDSYPGLSALGF